MIDGVLLCEYSPADSADYAEECSMAALFRRERQIGLFEILGFVYVNQGETLGGFFGD